MVTTEVQVTSSTIPTRTSYFPDPPDRHHTTDGPSRRLSDTTTLRPNHSNESGGAPRLATPVVPPNAPGILSPVQSHNYPWSREPSAFPSASAFDDPAVSPGTTLVNSNDSGGSYGFPKVPSNNKRGTTGHQKFEHTGFNGATQFTSISVGSSKNAVDDRDSSPNRVQSPVTILTTTTTTKISNPTQRREGKKKRSTAGASAGAGKDRAARRKKRLTPGLLQRLSRTASKFGARLRHMDPVKLAYLRTSFVFAISVLVTWTPSSINRVYTLIYPDRASWGLNIAAAVVLPLQGVWNAVIYFTTSWKIFRQELEATRGGRRALELLRLDSGAALARRGGGASFALASSLMTPRSEMGRSRRLEGDSYFEEEVEMTTCASPIRPQRPRPVHRGSTIRVMKKGLEDFA